MKLVPHESDNWDDFDLRAALSKYLAENHLSAEDALEAIIRTLVDDYRYARLDYPGEMPTGMLHGMELILRQQEYRNNEIFQQEAGDDSPEDGDFLTGEMCGMLSCRQGVVADLLCDCMNAVGCQPIRKAA